MSDFGILAFGAYVPVTRLQRSAIHATNKWFAKGLGGLAKGEKAIANWDEDSVTMALEAARDALDNIDRARVERVVMASTTLPFADRQNAGIVKEALNLPDGVGAMDVTGSQRAATSALLGALEGRATTLVCAAEVTTPKPASEREMAAGDAAAALLVGAGAPIATLIASHSVTVDFVDHFREAGAAHDYDWEARWVRDEGFARIMTPAIAALLDKGGVNGDAVDQFIVPVAVKGVPEMLAKKAGISDAAVADPLTAALGHAGAAHALVMLSAALEVAKPGARILLASFGQGCDLMLFEVTDAIGSVKPRLGLSGWLARRSESANYAKYLSHRGLLQLDRGMRAEHDSKTALTALWRNRRAVLGLVGGRCIKTGTVQFPKSEVSVHANDHAIGTQEDYPLAEMPAKVMTWTADALTYSPDPPSYYGNIDFVGGGRMMAEFTDFPDSALQVGADLRMMFRIKAFDENRGFRRYFWKAAPAF
ncbi:3-hydroxy-3-methylglutaryl CoA synthase [Sphingopyxis sp. Root214]|uniref:3-oxoacyl-[acyl-carrier-protein] synthase III C-terminal domain-containing protein n=1 Tax=unclassified Sphingopyxis TaxID=2614943 RepID=UPI0006F5F7C4|nr:MULTISPECIES: 3-oxoacyl-[acyl-carrier-protein] synthase III C-terminal domain-containing protein [unclassified Sphingopyxis]KQZ73745.1 3-hydroxy-3-methylglutaryl CoA synthase [Sphingopyxis sp. Root154]KRC07886.1 3-hydroxy-3-methylglutaryl CoA synthase [Sphingopyxis sp. Root214]